MGFFKTLKHEDRIIVYTEAADLITDFFTRKVYSQYCSECWAGNNIGCCNSTMTLQKPLLREAELRGIEPSQYTAGCRYLGEDGCVLRNIKPAHCIAFYCDDVADGVFGGNTNHRKTILRKLKTILFTNSEHRAKSALKSLDVFLSNLEDEINSKE